MRQFRVDPLNTDLGDLVEAMRPGERLELCRGNVVIAEIVRRAEHGRSPRPAGLVHGQFTVPPSFFQPMRDQELDVFEGR